MSLLAERCKVVLVRPRIAANLGAAARAMHNFGLRRMVLVQPHAEPLDPEALPLSTQAEFILHEAESVATLEAAVADCGLVLGTSARLGGLFRKQNVVTPREIMPQAVAALANGPVALVFGPEATGLVNEEITRCHFLVTIPAAAEYPVMNLAQAVAVCVYELFQAWQDDTHATSLEPRQVAPHAMQELVFHRLEAALREIHYLWDERAPALMHGLRHLLGRAQMSPMEAELLLGMARQMVWHVRHAPPVSPLAAPADPPAAV